MWEARKLDFFVICCVNDKDIQCPYNVKASLIKNLLPKEERGRKGENEVMFTGNSETSQEAYNDNKGYKNM